MKPHIRIYGNGYECRYPGGLVWGCGQTPKAAYLCWQARLMTRKEQIIGKRK